MNVREAIYNRRSVREFLDKEISDDIIKELLKDAMAAPSACNKKAWEFYVIKNKEKQEELKKAIRYGDYNSPLIIIVAGNNDLSLTKDSDDYWVQDCSAAIENILLSALEFGLGTCWCGLMPVVRRAERVKKILNLSDNIVPLGMLHIGYPKKNMDGRTQYDEEKVHYVN